MLNYQTWLEKPNTIKTLLVQINTSISGSDSTIYLSTHGITVDGITYEALIKDTFNISESINTDYSASISYGDIQIPNTDGSKDVWLSSTYIWVNKSIKVYYGELPSAGTTSTLSDFQLVFDGIVADIDSKDRFTINFKVRDKLEKLNTTLTETLLRNYYNGVDDVLLTTYTNQNSNSLRPVCFGEVFNITPMLSDPVNLHYMVNTVAVESILEVRDNGVPVSFSTAAPVPNGSFRLLQSPVGTVTCSVQGTKLSVSTSTGAISNTYSPTASNTILTILRNYGKTLAATDIDLTSFSSLGTQSVGVYLTDRTNVLQICQEIAKNCGLVLSVSRLGMVKLVDINVPPSSYSLTITDSDVFLNTLAVSRKLDVAAGVKLGYSKNYTQQPNLLTSIPQQHKDFFASEYTESIAYDQAVKINYSITVEPVLEPTYLIDATETDAVALKKLNLFKTPRYVYKMTCTSKFLSLQVGDGIYFNNISRFNLSGVTGLVISTNPNWLKGSIDIEVLV